MDNQNLLNETVKELATRLGNTEIERANFRAQAIQALQKNEDLKKQVNDLTKQVEDLKDKLPKLPKEEDKTSNELQKMPNDPQPGM